ncbi:MAG: hypothetical protein HOH58_09140 [Opitutaceae bacterium]|nr:hypothetical protein [Opitutaceae bacterium]
MERRHFLQLTAAGIIGQSLLGKHIRAASDVVTDRDQYGGWTGLQFTATGYFRTEKTDRWWLVTPEGNAFLSFGINHLYPDLWKQPYNQQAWLNRLGVESVNGPAFQKALRKWFLETCGDFGFNTVGVHTHLPTTNSPRPALPYMKSIKFIDVPHWKGDVPDENFLDVFAPEFTQHCDRLAQREAAPLREDPYVLGYAMTDCPLFTEEDLRERTDTIGGARRGSRIGWPRRFRNLPASTPGKQAYVKTVRGIYQDNISTFNTTYGTAFDSFEALAEAQGWRPETQLSNIAETRDNAAFMVKVVDTYYRTTRDAIRRHDPNHMFFGDKLNANSDSLDTMLEVTSRYTDVVFYQMYARYEVQRPGLDRWSRRVDLPFINGDSAFTMVTEHMPRPYGPIADTLAQRAEWTEAFMREAFARPEFVGWHYCGLIDADMRVSRKQDRQHSGLLDGFGESYPLLEKVIKNSADDLYQIASNGLGGS